MCLVLSRQSDGFRIEAQHGKFVNYLGHFQSCLIHIILLKRGGERGPDLLWLSQQWRQLELQRFGSK
ncbi:hypothetical protein RRG08_066445 [Elysia crispata]|uniref:Uncharacterized protein n=1 Tax=Elysia crispata TaxID=231223 RepID=A0AAE0ZDM4_9GAST|nr:hypothetical protein RRG08_066445 [Elysia crispata]